jgi:hypothetical protein
MGQGDPVRKAYFLAYPQRVKCGLSVSNGNETDLILPCSAKGFFVILQFIERYKQIRTEEEGLSWQRRSLIIGTT